MSATKWAPPPDLLEFIETAHKAKRKVVYIGFGSIVVSDPKAMTKIVVEAIVQSGVYAILSKGWSDRLVKAAGDTADVPESYPKQIYPISSIPHDWLFNRIDAACHHGGAGTTGASLRGMSTWLHLALILVLIDVCSGYSNYYQAILRGPILLGRSS